MFFSILSDVCVFCTAESYSCCYVNGNAFLFVWKFRAWLKADGSLHVQRHPNKKLWIVHFKLVELICRILVKNTVMLMHSEAAAQRQRY